MPDDNYIIPPDTDAGIVARMSLQERVDRAIALLKTHEPVEGYYLAYSGGKDSDTCKKLLQLSGVKFESWYNQTTIDPPELVRHVKSQPDVKWNLAEMNMMVDVAQECGGPPTRMRRWCCRKYKERGGDDRVKVMGVRAAESPKRKIRWHEIAKDMNENKCICPIVYWSDLRLWEFIEEFEVKYCPLYDESFEGEEWDRMGCVGCPLQDLESQARQFRRWPAFQRNWKKAVIANWERFHDTPRRDGQPRFHARFKTGEEFWQYWINTNRKKPDVIQEGCQSGLLWTNEDLSEINDDKTT